MCFVLPSNTRFFVIDIVDLLSQRITMGFDGIKFHSSVILLIQIDFRVAHNIEIHFAFEDDKTVLSCFSEVQASALDTNINTYLIRC